MIPELGQIFLVAALASALFQFLGGISPLLNKIENIETFIDRVTTFQTISIVICFALLTTSFLQDDFSVLYYIIYKLVFMCIKMSINYIYYKF